MSSSPFTGRHWWIGVVVALSGNFIESIGWVTEKKSHINLYDKSKDNLQTQSDQDDTSNDIVDIDKRSNIDYLCNKQWWCGFMTHIIGALLFAIALGLGDQALLMPLQSIQLVFNTILAWKFLNETLNKPQIFGTILIIIGCALAVAFGPKTGNDNYSASDLELLFRNPTFLIYAAVIIILALIDYILFKCTCKCTKILWQNRQFLMLSYIGISAFWTSWNTLFTKCFIEIVASSFESTQVAEHNWTQHWLGYVSGICVCFTTVSLEYWRQEALKEFAANYVGSIYTMMIIIMGICFGAFFFKEFVDMTMRNVIIFAVAVLISFIGVAMLTYFHDREHLDDNDDETGNIEYEEVRNGRTKDMNVSESEIEIEYEKNNDTIRSGIGDIEILDNQTKIMLNIDTEMNRFVCDHDGEEDSYQIEVININI